MAKKSTEVAVPKPALGKRIKANWQLYLLSSHTEFERCFGRTADRKRKLYNGMIKCDLFMYYKDRKA